MNAVTRRDSPVRAVYLAAFAAALVVVVAVRWAVAVAPQPVVSPETSAAGAGSGRIERTDDADAVDWLKMESLEVLLFMERNPMEVIRRIGVMEDRDEAAVLARVFVENVQGPWFDVLRDWALREKDPRIVSEILLGMMPRWYRADPAGCMARVSSLEPGPDTVHAKEYLVDHLPTGAGAEFLKTLTADERQQILKSRMPRFASRNPQQALDLIQQLPAGEARTALAAELATAWSSGVGTFRMPDPVSAVRAIVAIEDETLRRSSLTAATAAWCASSRSLAEKWLTTLPAGTDRDAAIRGFLSHPSAIDPEIALRWAEQVSDPQAREAAIGLLQQVSQPHPDTR